MNIIQKSKNELLLEEAQKIAKEHFTLKEVITKMLDDLELLEAKYNKITEEIKKGK